VLYVERNTHAWPPSGPSECAGDAAARYIVVRATMSTVAINPSQQQRLLDLINRRLDQLDAAASPAVTGILTAADRLPPADRIYVKRRLQAIGAPDAGAEWASVLRER
jgi:hypothetical protein